MEVAFRLNLLHCHVLSVIVAAFCIMIWKAEKAVEVLGCYQISKQFF
jgi:hypothetical protein